MATLTKRGLANVFGCKMAFDVVLYPVPQSAKATHQFEEKKAKDYLGQDNAWVALNEMIDGEIALKLLGDTNAHAIAGAVFLAPLAVVTISTADQTLWNTTWEVVPGSNFDLKNDDIGDYNLRLRRYVDSTQNTLAAATPT